MMDRRDDRFELTEGEKASPVWLRLKGHLTELLAAARLQNDNETLTEQQTAALRGRIKVLKVLLALGDDARPWMTGTGEQPPY
jgi:hypothetical protein